MALTVKDWVKIAELYFVPSVDQLCVQAVPARLTRIQKEVLPGAIVMVLLYTREGVPPNVDDSI